jgi:hypothetical protein
MSQKPINAGIVGWLSSLGLKQNGTNPVELADQVQASLDIDPFYQIANEETLYYSGTTSGNVRYPNLPPIFIPSGEIWAVRGISGCLEIAGGSSITAAQIRVGMFSGNSVRNFFTIGEPGAVNNNGVSIARPVYLRCGALLRDPVLVRGGGNNSLGMELEWEEPASVGLPWYFEVMFRRFTN